MLGRRSTLKNQQWLWFGQFNILITRRIGIETPPVLDGTDWLILTELQADARLSFNELARRVHLSAPAVAERVRRLEREGAITGYAAQVDPAKTGAPLLAFIRLRCRPGLCLLRTTSAGQLPEITEIHKLPGEHCALLKARAASLEGLEGLLEVIGKHGRLETDIVLSTQFEHRPLSAPQDIRPVTRSKGWSRTGESEGAGS